MGADTQFTAACRCIVCLFALCRSVPHIRLSVPVTQQALVQKLYHLELCSFVNVALAQFKTPHTKPPEWCGRLCAQHALQTSACSVPGAATRASCVLLWAARSRSSAALAACPTRGCASSFAPGAQTLTPLDRLERAMLQSAMQNIA